MCEYRRRIDANAFFRQVNGLAPEDPANAISSGLSQGTHLVTTTDHYAKVLIGEIQAATDSSARSCGSADQLTTPNAGTTG
jgi:hypothetical protein